ncbi:MAG: DUF359 domain-containing protein [Candidatus Bathyarchaeota archaeon]|nr:MAG: DUF359 domain-containing protein [Candidatus Bathyarchaeota archaeon]
MIKGSFNETMERLRELIDRENPSILISVGDVVSDNMIRHNIQPEISIVDNKIMRRKIEPIQVSVSQTLQLRNPAGTLTEEAWTIMQKALEEKTHTRVLVNGEEDLLTLIAVLCAPENSMVIYGQPQKGIVAVRVTEQKREQVRQIVDAMEVCESLK